MRDNRRRLHLQWDVTRYQALRDHWSATFPDHQQVFSTWLLTMAEAGVAATS